MKTIKGTMADHPAMKQSHKNYFLQTAQKGKAAPKFAPRIKPAVTKPMQGRKK